MIAASSGKSTPALPGKNVGQRSVQYQRRQRQGWRTRFSPQIQRKYRLLQCNCQFFQNYRCPFSFLNSNMEQRIAPIFAGGDHRVEIFRRQNQLITPGEINALSVLFWYFDSVIVTQPLLAEENGRMAKW